MLDGELTTCATTNEAGARMVGRMDGWKVLAVNKRPPAGVPDGSYLGLIYGGDDAYPSAGRMAAVSVPYRRGHETERRQQHVM